MIVKRCLWWQKVKQHWVAIVAVVTILTALVALIFAGYWFNWSWTGFGPETSEPTQHAKTLWDWLDLLAVLAIPVVVGLGTLWFTTQQAQVSDAENKDNQRETALQKYIDKMSDLLLKDGLRKSETDAEVRQIARARTLTVLRRLDADRKGSLLQFLYESDLINTDKRIIDLRGADLKGANLQGAYLRGADLKGANLQGANLQGAHLSLTDLSSTDLSSADLSTARLRSANLILANLRFADLRNVNLEEANLSGASLSGANLHEALVTNEQLARAKSFEGLINPDGTTHP